MAARRVNSDGSAGAEARHLRATLAANSHPTSAGDPLRLRRDALDRDLRALRSHRKTMVEAVD